MVVGAFINDSITSGTYVNREFQIELGKIPPCFLPLANNKLYVHQINVLREKYKNKKNLHINS